MTLTHVDLFSGIGGFSLAAGWAGFETVLHCEIDPFCQRVLAKHWPEVPIHGDIRTLTADLVATGTVTLLTGGFPCQPFSQAGKRRGKEDDRHLWPEMCRVIAAVRPRWLCGENVAGFVSLGLDDCLFDLESAGYEAWPVMVPAAAVAARHRRDRIFIIAHDALAHTTGTELERDSTAVLCQCEGRGTTDGRENLRHSDGQGSAVLTRSSDEVALALADATHQRPHGSGPAWERRDGLAHGSRDVADAHITGPQGHGGLRERAGEWLTWSGGRPLENIWQSEPAVGRVAHGVSGRVDRLRALGNAVVPQQVYPILTAIAEYEQKQEGCPPV